LTAIKKRLVRHLKLIKKPVKKSIAFVQAIALSTITFADFMTIPESKLVAKKSTIADSGKGLFTKVFIPKGTRIIEYKGTITTWEKIKKVKGENGYIYYVNKNWVIDAAPHPKALARYANDARGLKKVKGITNNSDYTEDGVKVYITAKKDIPAGSEILVGYGKEYWDTIRYNLKIDQRAKKK
jgi:SET domain-containing protein